VISRSRRISACNSPARRHVKGYRGDPATAGFAKDIKPDTKQLMANNNNIPDLTQHPPRSPRVRLGGYSILPRMLDKGRAAVAGKNGEYHYACPMDQRFLDFTGINADELTKQLAAGKGDGDILAWIEENAKIKRTDMEISTWSHLAEQRSPTDVESRKFFNDLHEKAGPKREDIATWFDLLDLDDYISFGGKA
jgi:hypothetical protein